MAAPPVDAGQYENQYPSYQNYQPPQYQYQPPPQGPDSAPSAPPDYSPPYDQPLGPGPGHSKSGAPPGVVAPGYGSGQYPSGAPPPPPPYSYQAAPANHVTVVHSSGPKTVIVKERRHSEVNNCLHLLITCLFPPWLIVWLCLLLCYCV